MLLLTRYVICCPKVKLLDPSLGETVTIDIEADTPMLEVKRQLHLKTGSCQSTSMDITQHAAAVLVAVTLADVNHGNAGELTAAALSSW